MMGAVVHIPLRFHNFVAIADATDAALLIEWMWCAQRKTNAGYIALGRRQDGSGNEIERAMQRVLMPEAEQIVFLNGNHLDCRRENLKAVYHGQVATGPSRGGFSKYKGVCCDKKDSFFRAYIVFHGKQIHLGCHNNEENAARAYDKAAFSIWGDVARLNFPDDDHMPIPWDQLPWNEMWDKEIADGLGVPIRVVTHHRESLNIPAYTEERKCPCGKRFIAASLADISNFCSRMCQQMYSHWSKTSPPEVAQLKTALSSLNSTLKKRGA